MVALNLRAWEWLSWACEITPIVYKKEVMEWDDKSAYHLHWVITIFLKVFLWLNIFQETQEETLFLTALLARWFFCTRPWSPTEVFLWLCCVSFCMLYSLGDHYLIFSNGSSSSSINIFISTFVTDGYHMDILLHTYYILYIYILLQLVYITQQVLNSLKTVIFSY